MHFPLHCFLFITSLLILVNAFTSVERRLWWLLQGTLWRLVSELTLFPGVTIPPPVHQIRSDRQRWELRIIKWKHSWAEKTKNTSPFKPFVTRRRKLFFCVLGETLNLSDSFYNMEGQRRAILLAFPRKCLSIWKTLLASSSSPLTHLVDISDPKIPFHNSESFCKLSFFTRGLVVVFNCAAISASSQSNTIVIWSRAQRLGSSKMRLGCSSPLGLL